MRTERLGLHAFDVPPPVPVDTPVSMHLEVAADEPSALCGDKAMRWKCALPVGHDGDHRAKPNKTRPSARWPQ